MPIILDRIDPRNFASLYSERRIKAKKKAAKACIRGDASLNDRASEYAEGNAAINDALRRGFAAVAIDNTCNPTDVSIRRPDGHPICHLPANMIEDDVHELIMGEAGRLAGIDLRIA